MGLVRLVKSAERGPAFGALSVLMVALGLVAGMAMPLAKPSKAAELIMLEEDGCPWCAQWDKEIGVVYHKTTEGRRAPLRRLDIHAAMPADLQGIPKGRYTPTFILVEGGREIGRIRGYPGEDFFWGLLGRLLKRLPATGEQQGKLIAPTEAGAWAGGLRKAFRAAYQQASGDAALAVRLSTEPTMN